MNMYFIYKSSDKKNKNKKNLEDISISFHENSRIILVNTQIL